MATAALPTRTAIGTAPREARLRLARPEAPLRRMVTHTANHVQATAMSTQNGNVAVRTGTPVAYGTEATIVSTQRPASGARSRDRPRGEPFLPSRPKEKGAPAI